MNSIDLSRLLSRLMGENLSHGGNNVQMNENMDKGHKGRLIELREWFSHANLQKRARAFTKAHNKKACILKL